MLLVPAPLMPMTAEVGFEVRHDDEVEHAGRDVLFAARTDIRLAGVIWLHRLNGDRVGHPRNPQATRPTVTSTKSTTMRRSIAVFFCSRNGLNPMGTQW